MNELRLTDLVDRNILQQMQDNFSRYTGMAALMTDEHGVPVTNGSGFAEICTKLVRKTEEGLKRCEECDRNGALRTFHNGKPIVYRCHAGLMDFAAPIMVENKIIGGLIGGQVRSSEIDREEMTKIAEELGIDPEEYITAAEKTLMLPTERIEKAAEFLCETTKILSDMAYSNYVSISQSRKVERAVRSQSAYIMNMSLNMENNFNKWVTNVRNAVNSGSSEMMETTVKNLLNESSNASTIIGDTVEYIRMMGGDIELNETAYSLRDVLDRIVRNTETAFAEKQLFAHVDIDDSVPEFLLGDSGLIGQIINKLIYDSIFFTEKGGITIKASCRKSSYASMLRIKISDTGRGMTSEQLERVQRFFTDTYLMDDDKYRESLSFPMIGVLMKYMSGKVEVSSVENVGTEFVLTIPQLEVKNQ